MLGSSKKLYDEALCFHNEEFDSRVGQRFQYSSSGNLHENYQKTREIEEEFWTSDIKMDSQ
jgi:hypothetical protein